MKSEKNYYTFVFLLTHDESLSKELASELVESDNDPEGFFAKHSPQHFSNRNITKAGNPEQTLCYLLDKLEEHGHLFELDWKADVEALNEAIIVLSKGEIEDELFDDEDEEDADGMAELLMDADDRLTEFDLSIVEFALESDSHPITIVPLEDAEKINALMDELF
ncbi:MAG: hypothetical protein QE487_15175 [Fluviicola sp.]|nr:hypothetical protein [Fluviicola sp.]